MCVAGLPTPDNVFMFTHLKFNQFDGNLKLIKYLRKIQRMTLTRGGWLDGPGNLHAAQPRVPPGSRPAIPPGSRNKALRGSRNKALLGSRPGTQPEGARRNGRLALLGPTQVQRSHPGLHTVSIYPILPCCGLLVMSDLGLKVRVDLWLCASLVSLSACNGFMIQFWCSTCWPLGSQHGSQATWSTYLHICT